MTVPEQGMYQTPPDWIAEHPFLHQSLASELMAKSPLHAWHKAFGPAGVEKYNEVTSLGRVAHAVLLGGERIVLVQADNWHSKSDREERDEILAAGKVPILAEKFRESESLVHAVKRNLASRPEPILLESTAKETTVVWQTIGSVWCAGRIDYVDLPAPRRKQEATIIDFKFTGRPVTRHSCENSFIGYGYDIQHAAYVDAITRIFPALEGRVTMIFIFCETQPPYAVRVMPLAGSMRTSGSWRWGKAAEAWKKYLDEYGSEKPWPAYLDDYQPAECPRWALNEQIGDELAAQIEEERTEDENVES